MLRLSNCSHWGAFDARLLQQLVLPQGAKVGIVVVNQV